MKKFIITICAIFIASIARADNATINWYVGDSVYDTTTCTIGGDINLPNAPNVPGHTFLGWKPLYTQIEYLESTGTQYIDTKFSPNQDTQAIITFMPLHNEGWVFGARLGPTSSSFAELFTSNKVWRSDYAVEKASSEELLTTPLVGQKITINKNKNVSRMFNTSTGTMLGKHDLSVVRFQIAHRLYLFGINDNGVFSTGGGMMQRVYSFKLYYNDVLVCDMIPVLDQNGVACMFDKVSKTFFYNSGTGDFVAGPIIGEE